jgi:hypothetical protein
MGRMFRAILPLLAMMAAGSLPAAADTPDYKALVARVQSGDQSVDFGQLREAYVKSEGYDPYSGGIGELSAKMRKAATEKDCKTALAQAKQITDVNFVFIDAHLTAAYCHDMIGQPADAERARKIGRGLIASIMKSGDGKTPETAFAVVTVAEEYVVFGVLRLHRKGQALMGDKGHSYDRLTAVPVGSSDPNASVDVYFRIDPILAKARQLFGLGAADTAEDARPSPQ